MLGCRVPRTTRRCGFPASEGSLVWLHRSSLVRPQRNLCHPVPLKATGKGDGKKDDKADIRKADTSAYWALKVREFFSPRKKYLDQSAEQLGDADPEILKRVERALDAETAKLDQAEEEQLAAHIALREQQLRAEAEEDAREQEQEQQQQAGAGAAAAGQAYRPLSREEVIASDIGRARNSVRQKVASSSWAMTSQRVQRLVLEFVMMPIILLSVLRRNWVELFASQRYENFLMAEGERIWYWRNRTENERWFWEIFAWDRLIFPTICAYAYQRLVPGNFVWSVIIPLAFIYWQDGELPFIWHYEFWLVFYFGFWQKCLPGFLAFMVDLLQWA